jgi:hypothetical protein
MTQVNCENKGMASSVVELNNKSLGNSEVNISSDLASLSNYSFGGSSDGARAEENQVGQRSAGFINKAFSGGRDFVSASLEAISTWSATLADGVGKTSLILADYASKAISKITQNIATPETNHAVADAVETVTPAIGFGVGKTVGNVVSGLTEGLARISRKN